MEPQLFIIYAFSLLAVINNKDKDKDKEYFGLKEFVLHMTIIMCWSLLCSAQTVV